MKKVGAYKQNLVIPTYVLGKSEVNPVFFEKRVYQGSSGKVYPVPFIDKVHDHKIYQTYDSVVLENDFVRMVMLPEIGGRIFEAQDKANNNYNFFYQQKVIKPALVGLAGPWISGGVEFNWPQHHRPGTYLPSDSYIEELSDGSRIVWMSEYDPMKRLKGMHGIKLRPDSNLIELKGRLFNRTPFTQTFLWWANVAVETHDQYQSFFPPDVNYVADHAVRAMSSFPMAENYYYGIPYHERKGKNDLRKYEHIPVPTSFMVCETEYDFFGGYDFKAEGGFIHVANRHIAPGKKQWTWGNDEFGHAWDRELTDEGGPYLELMAGVYTDNQPDFSYLQPYETKTFSQYWWSYKKLGPVQNANKDLAIRLEIIQDNLLDLGVASSSKFEGLKLILKINDQEFIFDQIETSPERPWMNKENRIRSGEEQKISLSIFDQKGHLRLSYFNKRAEEARSRKVAIEPPKPDKINSSSELELIGEHLELYRHPTRYPAQYWNAALQKDPKNYNAYLSLGKLLLNNGQLEEALSHFSKANEVLTSYHPNPITGEAYYFVGICHTYLGNLEQAYTYFYKATWNYAWRSAAYYHLATLDCRKSEYQDALENIERSLDTNRQNNKAIVLKAIVLRRNGEPQAAESVLKDLYSIDPLDQWANFEYGKLKNDYSDFLESSRNDAQTIIDIAFDYTEAGFYEEALEVIQLHKVSEIKKVAVPNPMSESAMTEFIRAWCLDQMGQSEEAKRTIERIKELNFDYFFPSRIQEQLVLEWVIGKYNNIAVAYYGLGNYYYNLKRHEDAILTWERATTMGCHYGTLYRNLGIAYWNTYKDEVKSRKAFLHAIELAPEDIRIKFEFDQLRKKINDRVVDRLADLLSIQDEIKTRDDFMVEFAALHNFHGEYEQALSLLESRNFHPWEGGEGMVLKQYTYSCLKLGQLALEKGNPSEALKYFEKSRNTPDNLGEKYHPLQAVAHINYWKGKAFQALGDQKNATKYFQACASEQGDFIDMEVSDYSELTYYKALSLKELGREEESEQLLESIKTFGENKLEERAEISYFATSLPLLLVFDDDLQQRSEIEARFLIALASVGLKQYDQAKKEIQRILKMNAMHVGAKDLMSDIEVI